jgi:hypothetical protein
LGERDRPRIDGPRGVHDEDCSIPNRKRTFSGGVFAPRPDLFRIRPF